MSALHILYPAVTADQFKAWLLSRQITESTYKILVENGLHEPSVFACLKPEHLKQIQITPFGQELIIQKIVESFDSDGPSADAAQAGGK
jgi:hypothetical protein